MLNFDRIQTHSKQFDFKVSCDVISFKLLQPAFHHSGHQRHGSASQWGTRKSQTQEQKAGWVIAAAMFHQ